MGKVFCALATGNVLFLSFALAGEGDVPVARPAVAIGAFMAGTAVAGVVPQCSPAADARDSRSGSSARRYHRACGNGYGCLMSHPVPGRRRELRRPGRR
jgi:hypothetical protein